MLVKLDVAVKFRRMFATSARIFFSSFFDQTSFFLLLCQLLHFLFELVLDLQLMLSQMIILLCSFRLSESTTSQSFSIFSQMHAIQRFEILRHEMAIRDVIAKSRRKR